MNLNKDPENWARVHPQIVLDGSQAQARNVLAMALQDIATLAAAVERLSQDNLSQQALDVVVERMKAVPDLQVWAFACSAVGVAGTRAQKINRKDIDVLCAEFVEGMVKLAGTPKVEI